MRKLTLAEITLIGTYTYAERPLAEGAAAFRDLHEGRSAAAKIILRP